MTRAMGAKGLNRRRSCRAASKATSAGSRSGSERAWWLSRVKDRHQTLVHSELGVHSTNPIRHDSNQPLPRNDKGSSHGQAEVATGIQLSHDGCESDTRVKQVKTDGAEKGVQKERIREANPWGHQTRDA